MNIVFLHEVSYASKPVYEYQDFAERLSYKGHDITVIDFDENVKGPFSVRMISKTGLSTVRVVSLPNIGIPFINILYARFRFRVEFKKILQSGNVDAVFLYSVFINGIDAVKICNKLGIRVVFRAIDAYHRLRQSVWQSWLLRRGESFIYRNANLIAVTNLKIDEYVHQLAEGGGVETSLVNHGVDTAHFRDVGVDNSLATALNINPNEFVIVFLGTTYEFSRLNEIIANFHRIGQKNPDVKLMIIGAGELDGKILAEIETLGLGSKVCCCGMIDYDQLPKYLSLAKIAILPFEINGITKDIIPIKLLQYLSSGLPVVSTPLPDVVNNFPALNSGVVYSSSDKLTSFMTTLQDVVENGNLENLAQNARRFASDNYSIDFAVNHLERILTPL